jgi:hypothetical protein
MIFISKNGNIPKQKSRALFDLSLLADIHVNPLESSVSYSILSAISDW